MSNVNSYIESGILESYVFGFTTEAENIEIENLIQSNAEINEEVSKIQFAYEAFAIANALAPEAPIKATLMATIDYTERMIGGEQAIAAPILSEKSTIKDFEFWLNNDNFKAPPSNFDIHVRIISADEKSSTAVVWMKDLAPDEVHHAEYERFLILEGTCTIMVENQEHYLKAGDYFPIPLYKTHSVKVTSSIPCKVILQRIAA